MADKDDNFDDWLDDTDESDGDISQDNIGDLLGAVEAEDSGKKAAAGKGSAELDQNNIDALLGLGASETAGPAADVDVGDLDQDNIDALLSASGDDAGSNDDFALDPDELDQDNIDALLNSSGADDNHITELDQDAIDSLSAGNDAATDSDDEGPGELAQDDIDSLLSDTWGDGDAGDTDDLDELFAGEDEEEVAGSDDLVQDNIDALLGGLAPEQDEKARKTSDEPTAPVMAQSEDETPPLADLSSEEADDIADSAFKSDFDEMDQLFADIDSGAVDDDPFQAEEIDFAELLGQTEGDDQDFVALAANEAGDDSPAAAVEAEDEFMTQAGAADDSEFEALMDDQHHSREKASDKKGLMIPAALAEMSKGVVAGIGAGIALLLLGLYFLFSGPGSSIDPLPETHTAALEQASPGLETTENFVPVSQDASYDMGKEGGEVTIELIAMDKDDQPLLYEITSPPRHGRLSGTAPNLTYLPDSSFPGEDRFKFMANDGTDASNIAAITITGPDLATLAKAGAGQGMRKATEEPETKVIKPQKPAVLAKDATYATISTQPVTIDWARLWQEANNSPFSPESVHVEIVGTDIKGSRLTSGKGSSHILTPDPYEAHTDTVLYRFKKGGFRSATRSVTINIELGSPAPEITIAELADGYLVGQSVVLDASASRDENRESLQFFWEQVAGVPIALHHQNNEGSRVAFTMPSTFYTDPSPGPTLALTVVDNTGKKVREEIQLKTVSRRQTALWRGENGTVSTEPPMQGRYFPWPFSD